MSFVGQKTQIGMKALKTSLLILSLFCGNTLLAQRSDHRNRQVDSLEQVLATNPPEGVELAAIYNALSNGYRHEAKKRIEYARRSIAVAEPLDAWSLVSNNYMQIGLAHDGEMRYDSTLIYFNRALAAAERMRDFKKYEESDIDNRLSAIYGNMGNLYNIQDSLHRAVEYYLKALALFEKHGWRESQANAYYNIGEMYLSMENYPQAEENYRRAAGIARDTGDSLFVAYADLGLAIVESAGGNYDRALEHALAAHDYFFSQPDEDTFQVAALNILAEIWLYGSGDVDRAEEYVNRALELMDTQEVWLIQRADAKGLMAEIFLRRGEWRAARDTALEAIEILDTDPTEPSNLLPLYEVLAKAYSHLGDAARADEYLDKLVAFQSARSTKHYQSAIREMETRYETEKKEARIATLEDERRLMVLLGVAAGAVLLLAMATLFFLWRWTAGRRRISEQQIVQLEQEKQFVATQALLDGEVQERTRLARDLHDGLGSILTGTKLNLQEMKNGATMNPASREHYDTAMSLVDQSMSEMRRVAHHLMPDALSRFGLRSAVDDFCRSVSPNIVFDWFGSDARLDPKLEEVIYRSIYELVNNALKYSGAGQIMVQIMQEDDRVAFTVQDDGRGFDPSEETKGTGLRNIRTRVASFGGDIQIDSKAGEGTEINVEIRL